MKVTRNLRLFALWAAVLALPGQFLGIMGRAQTPASVAPASPGDQTAVVDEHWSYYALVIGNDNYTFLPKLKTASSDARAIARVLQDEYGFSTSVLLNATRADVLDALVTYRRKLPANSSLIIYYAGHGINDPEAKVAYWLPVDARSANNANWISADDITAELRVIKAMHVLVIADSCYSGALMRGVDSVDGSADVKPDERRYYIDKLQQIKSRNIMASGGNEPVADDGGGSGHSVFANVLLKSLRDVDAAEFTGANLFDKVVVRVGGGSQQTPQYSAIVNSQHDGGDFVFMHQPGKTPPAALCCDVRTGTTTVAGAGSAPQPAGTDNVDDILARYRTAYEDEDVAELQLLWPSMKPDAVRNTENFFRRAKSVQLHTTLVGTPKVTDSSATITIMQDLSYVEKGQPKKVAPAKLTITLSRQIGDRGNPDWKIDEMK